MLPAVFNFSRTIAKMPFLAFKREIKYFAQGKRYSLNHKNTRHLSIAAALTARIINIFSNVISRNPVWPCQPPNGHAGSSRESTGIDHSPCHTTHTSPLVDHTCPTILYIFQHSTSNCCHLCSLPRGVRLRVDHPISRFVHLTGRI